MCMLDPYYLIHKSKEVGYTPELILSGRKINENMGKHLTQRVIELLENKTIKVPGAHILIMGFSFKENCPDIRNTRIIDVHNNFISLGCRVDIYDPYVSADEVKKEYDITLINKPKDNTYDAIVLAVAHDDFRELSRINLNKYGRQNYVLFDAKYLLNTDDVDGRL